MTIVVSVIFDWSMFFVVVVIGVCVCVVYRLSATSVSLYVCLFIVSPIVPLKIQ